jgi:hypothetical protein
MTILFLFIIQKCRVALFCVCVRPQLSVAKIADFFLMCKKIDRNINKKMIFTKNM